MLDGKYRAHSVVREDRADGSILLTSADPLGPVARCSTDWLDHWAAEAPDRVFIAERSGPGWREVHYAEARQQVRAIAAALLDRGLSADTPIMIISGNGVDHALLMLGAHYIGVPIVPVAEQYALIPGAQKQLRFIAGLIEPAMVYAADADKFGTALALDVFSAAEKVVSAGEGAFMPFADLLKGAGDVSTANAVVGPDTVAKILMTSGSTSHPKGVLTTHRMMCTNQTQIGHAFPFLQTRPPIIVDWLPWNHVFGSSHNFNLVLANGGSLYIDGGKPVPGLVDKTIENLRLQTGTIAFNVPIGFAFLRDAMREDATLRERYFADLDMLFYAGASLPQDVWADLEAMARDVRGEMPLFTSSWGLTETAPASLIQHEPTDRSGVVGVPPAGLDVKLIPDDDMRCEIRLKGPTIFTAYHKDAEKTAEAFDEEGYFKTGDAMRFVDANDINKGLKFDGRIGEDFKLSTGIWVRAAQLRLDALVALGDVAQDIVVTGADYDQIGLMIIPSAGVRGGDDVSETEGALICPAAAATVRARLGAMPHKGSSTQIRRGLFLAEPPSMAEGEITAKGNLNFRKLLTRRAVLVDRLYDDHDPATIVI